MRIGDTVVVRHTSADVVAIVAQRLAATEPPLAVGSVNLDHLHHFPVGAHPMAGGPEWLWLADGAPVAWRGARLHGTPWPRVTGADLLEPLLDMCADQGVQVGFLGGVPATHERLAAVLAGRHPDAAPARFWAPTRDEVESAVASQKLAAQIRGAGVRLLVVGLGKPRQELWIRNHARDTGAAVLLAFGAAGDFLAGVVHRAPEVYQRHGLEWLYRLRQEPRRLARRYLVQGPGALLQLRHASLEAGT
ncbi:WecB/TagA/CpsF family glycosyltransferase [Mycolicibacterium brisbanense]